MRLFRLRLSDSLRLFLSGLFTKSATISDYPSQPLRLFQRDCLATIASFCDYCLRLFHRPSTTIPRLSRSSPATIRHAPEGGQLRRADRGDGRPQEDTGSIYPAAPGQGQGAPPSSGRGSASMPRPRCFTAPAHPIGWS